jgi:hypothetical protein
MRVNKLQMEIRKTRDSLAMTGPLLKGSISKVILGKKTRSRGDRVAYLLTYKGEGNRTKSIYIKQNQVKEVKAMIQNYRKLKTTVNTLIELNVSLFKTGQMIAKTPIP